MKADLKSIYSQRIESFQVDLKKVKQQLFLSSMLRLLVVLLIILGIYSFWESLELVLGSGLLGLIVFFLLVFRHNNLIQKQKKIKAYIDINKTEIKVLNRDFSFLPDGKKYTNDTHSFSRDIDLFGENSFFQYLNRTALEKGEQKLAELLTENETSNIESKQKAIDELNKKLDFRQEFSAIAQLTAAKNPKQNTSIEQNLKNLKSHTYFTLKYTKMVSSLFSIISLGLIIAFFTDFVSWQPLLIWGLIGLLITGVYANRVNQLSAIVSSMQALFQQYHKLLKLLENADFSTELLQENQNSIVIEQKKASEILKSFSKAIDALDQRNNLIFGFFSNAFLLWDVRQSQTLEDWMKTYTDKLEGWFSVIALTDAYNSLGNFAFNHPDYTFPKITNNQTIVKSEKAVHPLIPPEEAVTNDFKIDTDHFFIVTGANMAGKSTFLRTVSLQIVMSNVGLPVCASSCEYTPIKLITSMRTVDSLAEEASYFYAELSRLKFIIDQLKKDHYFVVLDEILKGTNSKDKASGSQKFLEKLATSHSTGIIATHDLSLCKVAEELPNVHNHFFDAQIIDDELYFDYKFKDGVCQNMNASFLLRKMKIVDD